MFDNFDNAVGVGSISVEARAAAVDIVAIAEEVRVITQVRYDKVLIQTQGGRVRRVGRKCLSRG